MKTITTQRLILRPYTPQDAAGLYDYAKNPNVGPSAGWKPHESVEESEDIIRDIFLKAQTFAIILKETRRLIGSIALEKDRRRPGVHCKEIGYSLSEEYWGKGIMTEAAKAIIDYAFNELSMDLLSICTSETNIRSQGVIKNCNFHYEGTERSCYVIYDGTVRDSRCYSLLRSEWEEKK